MKQPISCSLLFVILFQCLLPANSWSLSQGEEFTLEKKTDASTSKNYPVSKQDRDFADRSGKAEKWLFKDLPRDLGGSLKDSFWSWGGVAFVAGTGLAAGLTSVDKDLQNSFQTNALFGNTTNEIVEWGLSPYTLGAASIITWTVGHQIKNPKLALTGKALSYSLALSLGIDAVGKVAFRRERPDGGNFSFPSGHATAAFSVAAVLTNFYGWKAGLPSFAIASFIGASRIDKDAHYLSDVVMGAVLGTAIGLGTSHYFKRKNPNLFIIPSISSHQTTLNFFYAF